MKIKFLSIIILLMILILGIFTLKSEVYASFDAGTGATGSGGSSSVGGDTVDDIMNDADSFLQKGKASIDETELKSTSDFLYNLLLGIGIIVAVVVGMIIGIKYMTSSVEGKAELKQAAIGYAAGCLVIFGAFGIWKLVINIFSSL